MIKQLAIISLIVILCNITSARAQDESRLKVPDQTGRPPLRARNIILETTGGTLTGLGVGAGSFFLGALVGSAGGRSGGDDLYWINTAVGFSLIGYSLGTSIGVYQVGDTDQETGSFWAAFGGGLLGGIAGGLIGSAISERAAFTGILIGAPITSMVMFNFTRRYKDEDK